MNHNRAINGTIGQKTRLFEKMPEKRLITGQDMVSFNLKISIFTTAYTYVKQISIRPQAAKICL